MITDLTTSMIYICPECSTSSLRTVSAFEIKKKEGLTLFCSNKDCNLDDVIIFLSKDKYKINIDCPICGEEHSFVLSQKTLWNKDFFILNCPQSGFGILFVGKDTDRLLKECSLQAETIAGIIAANDEVYDELDILFEIIEIINSLARENSIHCKCDNENIAININADSVILTCRNCSKSVAFNAKPEILNALSGAKEIIIE